MSETKYVILRESVWESIIKDVGSVVSLSAAVGLGVYLNSVPLQWVGAVIWMFVIVGAVSKYFRDNSYTTLEDAHRRLDELGAHPNEPATE